MNLGNYEIVILDSKKRYNLWGKEYTSEDSQRAAC